MKDSNIQWTDHTFNPWLGCRKVCRQCDLCYITRTQPFRFNKLVHGPRRIRTSAAYWRQPIIWNRRAGMELDAGTMYDRLLVFCLSLGDWLDDEVDISWFADLMDIVRQCPNLIFQLLTKRPQNWRSRIEHAWVVAGDGINPRPELFQWLASWLGGKPPENVWLGVSSGVNVSAILDAPAVLHFLSCEPMLEPLDEASALDFDWIIFGGESGPGARPCNIKWISDGLLFCAKNHIRAFVKQLGAHPITSTECGGETIEYRLPLKDSHGANMNEWPFFLRHRNFPVQSDVIRRCL